MVGTGRPTDSLLHFDFPSDCMTRAAGEDRAERTGGRTD